MQDVSVVEPPARRLSERIIAALIWIVATGLAWLVYFIAQLLVAAFSWGVSLNFWCLVPVTLVIPFLMGTAQERILRTLGTIDSRAWTLRTVIGWALGLVAMWLLYFILEKTYYYVPTEFGWGYLIVHGDRVMVAVGVIAWVLMGAAVGTDQGWTRPRDWSAIAMWAAALAAAWGVGAIATWAVRTTWPEIGYEPICVSCLMRFFLSALVGGAAISILTGIAVVSRRGSVAASLSFGLAALLLVTQSTSEPFSPRHLAAARVLYAGSYGVGVPRKCAFSEDGKVLASFTEYREQGVVTTAQYDLWRTTGWSHMSKLPGAISSAPLGTYGTPVPIATLDYFGVAVQVALKEGIDLKESETLYIISLGDNREITRITWVSDYISPDGRLRAVLWGDEGPELRRTSDDALVMYLQIPPDFTWVSPDARQFSWSPDGSKLAGCISTGGLWVWDVPQ